MERLGTIVQRFRNERDMSLKEFADRAGFKAMFISQIQNHKRIPTKDETLRRIASVLDITLEQAKAAANYSRIRAEMEGEQRHDLRKTKIALARTIAESDLDQNRLREIMQILQKEKQNDD